MIAIINESRVQKEDESHLLIFSVLTKKLFNFSSSEKINKITFGNLNMTFNNIFETFLALKCLSIKRKI